MSAHHDELQDIENAKHFWRSGGKWLFAAAVAAALGYLGYVVYQNHQSGNNSEAALAVSKLQNGDAAQLAAIQQQYGSSIASAQATLAAAAHAFDNGKFDDALKGFRWVLEHHKEPLLQAVAAQNLANTYLQQNQPEEALKAASISVDEAYQPLLDEVKGDIYAAQGKTEEAKKAYQAALDKTAEHSAQRELLELKLAQL